jgi:hypothetical protein
VLIARQAIEDYDGELYVVVNLTNGPGYPGRGMYWIVGEEPHTYGRIGDLAGHIAYVLNDSPDHTPESLGIFKLERVRGEAIDRVWNEAREIIREEEEEMVAWDRERGKGDA